MPVVAVNQFRFNFIGAKLLILITATIANSRFASERNDFKFTALAFIKNKALMNFSAVDYFADFKIYDRANGVDFNKFVPVIFENLLQADHYANSITKNRLICKSSVYFS